MDVCTSRRLSGCSELEQPLLCQLSFTRRINYSTIIKLRVTAANAHNEYLLAVVDEVCGRSCASGCVRKSLRNAR